MKVELGKIYKEIGNRDITNSAEEYLFCFATDFYHILSLLWGKSNKKVTKEFCIYRVREAIKTICKMTRATDVKIEEVEIQLNKDLKTLETLMRKEDKDNLITSFGIEMLGDRSTDVVMKLAVLIVLVSQEFKIKWYDIEDYEGTKN